MIDVFIRTSSKADKLRQGMRMATFERWALDPRANPLFMVDRDYRQLRLDIDEIATSDPYILTDDDVLPHGKDWITKGFEAMLAHPEYGACSTKSLIVGESPFKGEGDIFPVPCVGAPMWMRKGILKDDLPEYPFTAECIEIHGYMRKKGYLQGIINGIFHCHIGHGFSTNPRDVWGY